MKVAELRFTPFLTGRYEWPRLAGLDYWLTAVGPGAAGAALPVRAEEAGQARGGDLGRGVVTVTVEHRELRGAARQGIWYPLISGRPDATSRITRVPSGRARLTRAVRGTPTAGQGVLPAEGVSREPATTVVLVS